jgi:hypothetical protein
MERRVFRWSAGSSDPAFEPAPRACYTSTTAMMAAVSSRAVMPSAVFENVHSKSRSRRTIAVLINLIVSLAAAVTGASHSRRRRDPIPPNFDNCLF